MFNKKHSKDVKDIYKFFGRKNIKDLTKQKKIQKTLEVCDSKEIANLQPEEDLVSMYSFQSKNKKAKQGKAIFL